MTKNAMEMNAKYIFYWDDDVIPPPLTLYTLHGILEQNDDIGLVCGVYCTREDPSEPLIYKEHGKGAYWGFSIDPADPPEDIFSCGGGCIMARVKDIKKMTPPYWTDEQIVDDGGHTVVWGHDVRFVKNFREQSGKRTCVQGSLLCGHWDAEKSRMYELPKDSPPYKRCKVIPAHHEIVQCPPLDEITLARELQDTGGDRRVFLVEKKEQTKKSLSQILRSRFEGVRVLSQDTNWLAVCEGLRNGNKTRPRDSRSRDPGSNRNRGNNRNKQDSGKSGSKTKRQHPIRTHGGKNPERG
jgi:hypothetical protein